MDNKRENAASVPQVKVFPNNYEAEQSVLCCLLIDGDACGEFLYKIDAEVFYNKLNRKIFDAMIEVDKSKLSVDIISVNDYLEKKRRPRLSAVFVGARVASSVRRQLQTVRENRHARSRSA
jgi:replicative DNA helicase